MHRLFSLPRFPDEGQADARRAYATAWVLLLGALVAGPIGAHLQPLRAAAWLLGAASVAAASFLMMAIVLHDSLQRRKLEEGHRLAEASYRLDAQRRQADKLESLGRMAGRMAHDFNNLLTVINGYSDLLLSRPISDDEVRKDLAAIREAGERASGLIRRLATASGRQAANPRALDLSGAVSGSKAMLQGLVGADIELTMALEPGAGCVMADPEQIRQLLTNLAANVWDAMRGGGKLRIEVANVDLDRGLARGLGGLTPGGYVLLTVSDTGTGMSEDAMAHVFEPFFTTKQAASGAGLGLAEVYGIVKQSGGRVTVSSTAGRGSTFQVYFPRVPGPPAGSVRDAADSMGAQSMDAKSAIGGLTVLVVDDEPSVRRLIREILAPYGCSLLEAGGGEEALSEADAQQGKIDIAIVDFVMPGLNGMDLALQMERKVPALKTLYVSSATESIGMVSMLRHAPERVLLKPFTAEQLVARVAELARGGA